MAWPAWRSASWRRVAWSAGCGSVLHDGAPRCRGQQPRAAPPLSPSPWLTAAAIAIVSSDTTAHASCFHEGLLRITLCSPNSCCWSLSSSGPTKGGHMSWDTTSSAACCGVCRKKLRGGGPNPVSLQGQGGDGWPYELEYNDFGRVLQHLSTRVTLWTTQPCRYLENNCNSYEYTEASSLRTY